MGAGEFDESVSLVQLVNKKKEELWALFESIVLWDKIIDIILGCWASELSLDRVENILSGEGSYLNEIGDGLVEYFKKYLLLSNLNYDILSLLLDTLEGVGTVVNSLQ